MSVDMESDEVRHSIEMVLVAYPHYMAYMAYKDAQIAKLTAEVDRLHREEKKALAFLASGLNAS